MGTFESCRGDGPCTVIDSADVGCDDVAFRCHAVVLTAMGPASGQPEVGDPAPPPTFSPAPVPITFGP